MNYPDTRTDIDYNEKYLDKEDKLVITGFDTCIKTVISFLVNDMADLLEPGSYLYSVLKKELPEELKDTFDYEIITGVKETLQVNQFVDLIERELLIWLEHERDCIITNLLDDMSEENYAKNKTQFWR